MVNFCFSFWERNHMRQTYIAQVKAHDNYKLEVKIDYPGKSDGIVIFCHGSGPNTYDNPREIEGKHFNYFDLFADEFCRRSLAFCRWNTRGCAVSNHPPDFVAIDRAGYETYCPATSIQDIIGEKLCKSTAAVQICKNTAYGDQRRRHAGPICGGSV